MRAKHMALGGLFTALGIVILYLTLLIPTNTLTLLTLSSFMVCVTLLLTSMRTACLVYIATSIISFLFLPINLSILYILFFGCYGLIKAWIERLDCRILESVLKFVFFNVIFVITFNVLETALGIPLFAPIKQLALEILPDFEYAYMIIMLVAAQIGFAIFDYALSLLIDMYYNHKHILK